MTSRRIAVLKDILASGKPPGPEALQVEALRTLAAIDIAAAQAPARALLEQKDPALQSDAIGVLGTLPEGAKFVGERFLAKKLPRELLQPVTDALQKHAARDPEVARMLTEVMKSGLLLSLDKGEVERVRSWSIPRATPSGAGRCTWTARSWPASTVIGWKASAATSVRT